MTLTHFGVSLVLALSTSCGASLPPPACPGFAAAVHGVCYLNGVQVQCRTADGTVSAWEGCAAPSQEGSVVSCSDDSMVVLEHYYVSGSDGIAYGHGVTYVGCCPAAHGVHGFTVVEPARMQIFWNDMIEQCADPCALPVTAPNGASLVASRDGPVDSSTEFRGAVASAQCSEGARGEVVASRGDAVGVPRMRSIVLAGCSSGHGEECSGSLDRPLRCQ